VLHPFKVGCWIVLASVFDLAQAQTTGSPASSCDLSPLECRAIGATNNPSPRVTSGLNNRVEIDRTSRDIERDLQRGLGPNNDLRSTPVLPKGIFGR
jgi:hypothetical protein